MRLSSFVLALVTASAEIGCTMMCPAPSTANTASTPPPASPAASAPTSTAATVAVAHSPERSHHVYRLDFTVTGAGPQSAPQSLLTMNLEEGRTGEINSGANIPLTTTGTSRIDVGLKIKASYLLANGSDDALVDTVFEMSAQDDPSGIHKLVAMGQALATPGKPALIAAVDDPTGKKHVQITVTAIKLR